MCICWLNYVSLNIPLRRAYENIEQLTVRTVVHGQDSIWKLENQNLLVLNSEEGNTAGVLVRIVPIC